MLCAISLKFPQIDWLNDMCHVLAGHARVTGAGTAMPFDCGRRC